MIILRSSYTKCPRHHQRNFLSLIVIIQVKILLLVLCQSSSSSSSSSSLVVGFCWTTSTTNHPHNIIASSSDNNNNSKKTTTRRRGVGSSSSLNGWSQQIDVKSISSISNDSKEGNDGQPPVVVEDCTGVKICSNNYNKREYDLSSPREWLEFWEDQNHQQPGAYTVLRCDYYYHHRTSNKDPAGAGDRWTIWGKEFHLNRLKESYNKCLRPVLYPEEQAKLTLEEEHLLTESTETAIRELLALAQAKKKKKNSEIIFATRTTTTKEEEEKQDDKIVEPTLTTFMVTILWQVGSKVASSSSQLMKEENTIPPKIFVKGHITSLPTTTAAAAAAAAEPDPITAVIALPIPPNNDDNNNNESMNLNLKEECCWPNRKDYYPEAKLSSWCRQRRIIEERLKQHQPGISEVLLVRERKPQQQQQDYDDDDDDVEILEGLISNVFFVYKDGHIRTANSGVLEGYARHLVLQYAAEECGLIVDTTTPVTLRDANQWLEVFTTSSIRIITPINKLLIPRYDRPLRPLCNDDDDGLLATATATGQADDNNNKNNNNNDEMVVEQVVVDHMETIWISGDDGCDDDNNDAVEAAATASSSSSSSSERRRRQGRQRDGQQRLYSQQLLERILKDQIKLCDSE